MSTTLPKEFQALFEQLQNKSGFIPPTETNLECDQLAQLNQWRFANQWLIGDITPLELKNLTDWFDYCHDPRRFELADGYCVHLLTQGAFAELIQFAEHFLAQNFDPSLQHTQALAFAGSGDLNRASATLNKLLGATEFAQLPPELQVQVHADLAQLYQRQGMLFKALPSLYRAVELSADLEDENELSNHAKRLIGQLEEQGGLDEAIQTLRPLLSTERPALWALVMDKLGALLTEDEKTQGINVLLEHDDVKTVMRQLYDQAQHGRREQMIAFIVALVLKAPTPVTCPLAARLLMRDIDRQHQQAPLIAAASLSAAETFEERNPEQAKWHRDAVVQLVSVARHHGVPEQQVKTWVDEQQLYSEQGVVVRTIDTLVNEIETPPDWLTRLVKQKTC